MLTWTIDGWCGYPVNCTIDGWPRTGQTFTIDGWVADSGDPQFDVGGPLFRDGKKRRLTLEIERVNLRELAAKARIKRAERLANLAARKAIQEAKRLHEAELEARRVALEEARQARAREALRQTEEKAIAEAIAEAKRREEAKQKAIARARKLAEEAAEKARVLAAEEQQRQRDERVLEEEMPKFLKELEAVEAQFDGGIGEVLALLASEREELQESKPEPAQKAPTALQKKAMEALEAILETTKRIH